MKYTEFLLLKLMEECSEASQRASKQIQFTATEVQQGQDLNNSQRLRLEINDILTLVKLLEINNMIPTQTQDELKEFMVKKVQRLKKYADLVYQTGGIRFEEDVDSRLVHDFNTLEYKPWVP